MNSLPSQLLSIAIPQLPSSPSTFTLSGKADQMYAFEYRNSDLLLAKDLQDYYNFTHGTVYTTSPSRSVFGDQVSDAEEDFFMDLLGVSDNNSRTEFQTAPELVDPRRSEFGYTDDEELYTDDDAASYYSTVSFSSASDAEAAIFPERFAPAQNIELRLSITDLLSSKLQPSPRPACSRIRSLQTKRSSLVRLPSNSSGSTGGSRRQERPQSLQLSDYSSSSSQSQIFSPQEGLVKATLSELLLSTRQRHSVMF